MGQAPTTACSLREAILAANRDSTATASNPHVINVLPGKYLLTILGPGEDAGLTGDLDIINHVIVHGAGATTHYRRRRRTPTYRYERHHRHR